MKQIKKITGVLLILALIFTMSTTAFAANTNAHTITITNDKAGHAYTAYQVFKGDISNGKLTNIEWGSGVNGDGLLAALKAPETSPYKDCNTAEDVADVLKGFGDNSQQLDEFARIVGGYLSGTGDSSTQTASPYTIDVKEDGYYLVKDSGAIAENDAATKYILKVVGDVNVEAKSEVPSIDKIIVNADDGTGKGTAQDVGSSVSFKLTSAVPSMDGYSSYDYIVNDTLSDGLTFNDDVAVTIDGTADVNLKMTLLPTSCAVPFPVLSSALTIILSIDGTSDFASTFTSPTTLRIYLVAASLSAMVPESLTR